MLTTEVTDSLISNGNFEIILFISSFCCILLVGLVISSRIGAGLGFCRNDLLFKEYGFGRFGFLDVPGKVGLGFVNGILEPKLVDTLSIF